MAQTTADGISARLVGKVVFLRGMWSGNKLAFDADGQPLQKYKTVTFTESGLKVASVKMDGPALRIDGERVAIAFNPKGAASLVKAGGKTTVTIDGSADFGKAVDTIFAPDLASMIPSMPDYWLPYATKHFVQGGITPRETPSPTAGDRANSGAAKQGGGNVMHIGGSVRPPQVLQSSAPKYSDTAKELGFSGNVQVYLWIEEDGRPSNFQVVRPVGLGLDEAAIACVREYKFAPAKQNGKPVKVDLYIDVNFQIF
jgi:TonB family protein